MNITRINPDSVPSNQTFSPPAVRISVATSRVVFNAQACELLSIAEGDSIEFILDNDSAADFYIVKSADGFKVRAAKVQECCFRGRGVVNFILSKIPKPPLGKSLLIPIAKTPVEHEGELFYPLITAALKKLKP